MKARTPGPWRFNEINPKDPTWGACEIWPDRGVKGPVATMICGVANAKLIAEAPAMEVALRLIADGHARIERSGDLREFCFDGMRYIMNDNWNHLIRVIGWGRVNARLAEGPR